MKFYTPKELASALEKKDPKRNDRIKRDLAFRVAQMLIEARILKGVTQTELAEIAETKQSVIARAENGTHLVSLGFIKKLADAYGTYVEPPCFGFMFDAQPALIEKKINKTENSKRASFVIKEVSLAAHYESEFDSHTNTKTEESSLLQPAN